jgi:2-C-methyl-D-erythritol 4-phosphate cytidylyltransferase
LPKQFINVGGKPLISYCLDIFARCACVDIVAVVIAEEWRGILPPGCVCADPGKSRQHSVLSGLLALRGHGPDRVIIHDAVRPAVTAGDIENLIGAAEGRDGATPVLAVTDTTYLSTDGETITATLNRDTLFAGQTPECYDFGKYLAAHENLSDAELSAIRGSSEIAVRHGMGIALAAGRPENFKITTGADLARFRAMVESGKFV